MTLIKSISGIRGTIGGHAGEGLNPLDIVKFTSAYATLIRKTTTVKSNKIVVGRDVTRKYGCEYNASAVGEVNVVAKIRATNAVIGGEGNGCSV